MTNILPANTAVVGGPLSAVLLRIKPQANPWLSPPSAPDTFVTHTQHTIHDECIYIIRYIDRLASFVYLPIYVYLYGAQMHTQFTLYHYG